MNPLLKLIKNPVVIIVAVAFLLFYLNNFSLASITTNQTPYGQIRQDISSNCKTQILGDLTCGGQGVLDDRLICDALYQANEPARTCEARITYLDLGWPQVKSAINNRADVCESNIGYYVKTRRHIVDAYDCDDNQWENEYSALLGAQNEQVFYDDIEQNTQTSQSYSVKEVKEKSFIDKINDFFDSIFGWLF